MADSRAASTAVSQQLDRLGQAALHLEREVLDEHQRHEQPPLAGRPGDRDAALDVGDRVVVALEVGLGPAEVVERLEPRRQLGVGQPVDLGAGLLAVLAAPPSMRPAAVSPRHSAEAAAAIRARSPTARAVVERAAAHLDRLLEVELVEAVDGQLDLQRGRRRRRAVGQLLPGARRGGGGPRRGARASARPRRTARSARPGAPRRPAAAARSPRAASSRQRSSSPSERSAEASATRTSTWRSSSDAGQQPQRRLEPARRRGRGARARPPRPASSRSAIAASSPCAADCSTWWARSAGAAPRAASAAAARAWAREPPAAAAPTRRPRGARAGGGRRSGAAPASGARGRARAARRARRAPSGAGSSAIAAARSGSNGSPATAAASSSARSRRRERRELLGQRRRDGRRHAGYGDRAVAVAERRASVRRPRRARAARGRTGCRRRGGRSPRPPAGRGRRAARAASRLAQLARARAARPPGTASAADEARRGAWPGPEARARAAPGASASRRSSAREQLDRRVVAPVQVVEHEHERPVARRAARAARAPRGARGSARRRPLRSRRRRPSQRREDLAELGDELGVPAVLEVELLRGDVGVERVDPDAERQVALELGRRAGEHEVAALLGAAAQLGEQPRLADARLALDRDARLRASPPARRAPRRAAPARARARRSARRWIRCAPAQQPTPVRGRGSGSVPDVRRSPARQAGLMPTFLLHHRARAGASAPPPSPPGRASQSPLRHDPGRLDLPRRRPCDLVARAGRERRRRARAAAALRRPAHRPDRGPRRRDPLSRLAARLHCGRAARPARIGCSRVRDLRPLFDPRSVAVVGASNDPANGVTGSRRARSAAPTGATSGSSTGTAARSSASRLTARSRSCPGGPELVASRSRRRRSRRPSTPRSPPARGRSSGSPPASARRTDGGRESSGASSSASARREPCCSDPTASASFDAATSLDLGIERFAPGALGLISQSGNLALEVSALASRVRARHLPLRLSRQPGRPRGRRARGGARGDEHTRVIGVYCEDFRDGRAFARRGAAAEARASRSSCSPPAAARRERARPRPTPARSRATAPPSTPPAAPRASSACARRRSSSTARSPPWRRTGRAGRRVVVVGDGGGTGVVAADLATEAGLELPALSRRARGAPEGGATPA